MLERFQIKGVLQEKPLVMASQSHHFSISITRVSVFDKKTRKNFELVIFFSLLSQSPSCPLGQRRYIGIFRTKIISKPIQAYQTGGE